LVFLITYDLHEPERDYEDVIAKIKSFGSRTHVEESVWLVDTALSAQQCRDALNAVTSEARCFVVRLAHNWASQNVAESVTNWLKSPARTW